MKLVESKAGLVDEPKGVYAALRGWVVVCGIALLFVAYGFLAYFAIGDKGPPGWDFGSVDDVPGASLYSTYPYGDPASAPEPQHVSQRPTKAKIDPQNSSGKPPVGTPSQGEQ